MVQPNEADLLRLKVEQLRGTLKRYTGKSELRLKVDALVLRPLVLGAVFCGGMYLGSLL